MSNPINRIQNKSQWSVQSTNPSPKQQTFATEIDKNPLIFIAHWRKLHQEMPLYAAFEVSLMQLTPMYDEHKCPC